METETEKRLFTNLDPSRGQSSSPINTSSFELGHQSHGLGLVISKQIAKCLGGDLIYVKMSVGCRFKFQLQAKVLKCDIFNSEERDFLKVSYGFSNISNRAENQFPSQKNNQVMPMPPPGSQK